MFPLGYWLMYSILITLSCQLIMGCCKPTVTHIVNPNSHNGGKKEGFNLKNYFSDLEKSADIKKITKIKYLSPTGRPCQTQVSSRGRRGMGEAG